jgi:prevent-host-death family protein
MTEVSVAEAKRRFSELIDRVGRGERFVVSRRGRPAIGLVPPGEVAAGHSAPPTGLLAIAGALADWDQLDDVIAEIYVARRRGRDRAVPDLA